MCSVCYYAEAHEAGIGELDFKLKGFEEIRV